jgi:hypothetical protein
MRAISYRTPSKASARGLQPPGTTKPGDINAGNMIAASGQLRPSPDTTAFHHIDRFVKVVACLVNAVHRENQRNSWTKNQRSLVASWTRPPILRRKTINRCRSNAFSASSRIFDLNGETGFAGLAEMVRLEKKVSIHPEIFGRQRWRRTENGSGGIDVWRRRRRTGRCHRIFATWTRRARVSSIEIGIQ